MTKPWIAVDVDGVLADHVAASRPYFRENHGIELPEPISQYDFPIGNSKYGTMLVEAQKSPAFIADAELIPGARPAMERLSEMFRIAIVTARPVEAADWTRKWLADNHIPFDAFYSLGVCKKHQTGLDCIALVDDHTENIVDFMRQTGQRGVLFSQPWNDGWSEALGEYMHAGRCYVAGGWSYVVYWLNQFGGHQ